MSEKLKSETPVGQPRLVVPLRVLKLTLKKQWFDMIASGEKREEYREVGPWINSRIHGKKYDVVEFKNGYGTSVPTVIVEYKGAMHGTGKPEWGAIPGKHYLVLCLGKVISSKNMLPVCSTNNNARWCAVEKRWRIPADRCLACSESRHNSERTCADD